jgi:hypothetical protein
LISCDRVALRVLEQASLAQRALEAQHGILRRPLLEQLLRNVVGAGGFFVAAHAERLELEQRRPEAVARARSAATVTTWSTSSRSLPSATTPGMP